MTDRIDMSRELHGYRSELARLQDKTFALAHDLGDLVAVIDGAREEAREYELVPRHLAAEVVEFLERISNQWVGTTTDIEEEAAHLLRHWSNGEPSSDARALVDKVLAERYGPVPHDELAPTGEVF